MIRQFHQWIPFVLLGVTCALQADESVTIRTKDTGAALVNPGMGWTMHFYSNVPTNYGSPLSPADTLDDFPGVGADHVRADHALAGVLDHQLHDGALVPVAEGELEGAEGRLVDVHGAVALARFFLRESHRGDVRIGEHRGRDVFVVHRGGFAAKQRFRERHSFRGRHRREVEAIGGVADRVDRSD